MLFSFIPFLFHGLYLSMNRYNPLHTLPPLVAAVSLLLVHSFIKHKEFRFILPSLTLLIPFIGMYMYMYVYFKCILFHLLLVCRLECVKFIEKKFKKYYIMLY